MPLQPIEDFKLYTKQDYSQFISHYSSSADSIAASLFANESTAYVENIKTSIALISLGNEVWPISLNNTEYSNALTCSPFTTYVTYPLQMLDKFKALWIKAALVFNSVALNMFCRLTKINKVAQVNNTFNSLLKHPLDFGQGLQQLSQLLISKYPRHAILFFRVNEKFDQVLLNALYEKKYLVFPDRMVHIFDPASQFIKRSYVKRDLSLLRRPDYHIVQHDQLSSDDIKRIWQLYDDLFVGKHSKYNPHFTEKYFRDAVKNHWHHYVGLRNSDGVIDGFMSWYLKDGMMVCGPLGYDTSVPVKVGLYRRCVALALKYADEHNYVFNMGAGSDVFKQNRGSQKVLEYTAVYVGHLRLYRQLPWRLLRFACVKLLDKIYAKEAI